MHQVNNLNKRAVNGRKADIFLLCCLLNMDINFVIPVPKEKQAVKSSTLIDKGPEYPEKEGG